MTDRLLMDELARLVLGWRSAPDRYLKPSRGWIPRSKFRPLTDVRDAFRLLDQFTKDYSLIARPGQGFTVEVRSKGRTGRASGKIAARTVTLALANLIGLDTASALHSAETRSKQ
jgi:hypothetical protein